MRFSLKRVLLLSALLALCIALACAQDFDEATSQDTISFEAAEVLEQAEPRMLGKKKKKGQEIYVVSPPPQTHKGKNTVVYYPVPPHKGAPFPYEPYGPGAFGKKGESHHHHHHGKGKRPVPYGFSNAGGFY